MTREDGRRQRSEAKKSNERNQVPEPNFVTQGALRAYLGDLLFARIGFTGDDDDICDAELMRQRYFSDGGLTRFLEEGFPNSTSLKPFGAGQLRAISVMESVIRSGGVEQLLEPRAFGKSSRVIRAAIWALLGGFRRCGVVFQSSADKSVESLTKSKNELAGSPFLRALSPQICTACNHAAHNPGIAKRQHDDGAPTNIQWLMSSIRLPDIQGEIGGGGRLICMPFSKAAGVALSDPETLEDLRPDLLLPDDVQSHDDASSPRITEKLLRVWNGSVKYLCGRGKAGATVFTQTVFEADDMADQLSRDPSVHTVRYRFMESFSDHDDWWKTVYKKALLDYDPLDPNGQANARKAASALYVANRPMADKGAVVSWEHAYDPDSAASAIEQAYRNLLECESSFWAQDQNEPSAATPDDDVRAKASEILKKMHPEGRRIVPTWADRVVAHIDVHDSLLYFAVCAGSASMGLGLIDRQTFPKQRQKSYTLRSAATRFDDVPKYAALPTTQDKIRAALSDLYDELMAIEWRNSDGQVIQLSRIGIDCSDGDHMDTVHAFCRNKPLCVPMKGSAPTASQVPLNERPKGKSEKRRGDHWVTRTSERTKVLWLEFDSDYFKLRLHRGLKAPLETSESVSLYHTDGDDHHMTTDHILSELATFETSSRVGGVVRGKYAFTKLANRDNHAFDNFVNCLVLLCYDGGKFRDSTQTAKKNVISLAQKISERQAKTQQRRRA